MNSVNTEGYLNSIKRTRMLRAKIAPWIPLLSLLVVLGVFWWLKLTGITLAGEAFCGLEEHVHSEACYTSAEPCTMAEHIHTEMCYSDLSADLETQDIWETSVSGAALTNYLPEDIVAIARTQLGYSESRYNFILSESGERLGYTRYGEWYGNPYGKWSSMFVSFVFNYAGLPREAAHYNSGVESMRTEWERASLTYSSGNVLTAGDIVFFDKDANGSADSVGIISSASGEIFTAIEGDIGDSVAETVYSTSNPAIMSYGSVVEVVRQYASEADLEEIKFVISLIDELPTADEFEAKLAVYEASDDMTAYEEYVIMVGNRVSDAYVDYELLGSKFKLLVTNYDKLQELEWLTHTPSVMVAGISSNAPTTVSSADTSDLIQVNLYDYKSNINTMYESNTKYPGFQWNGGAYKKSSLTYNRHLIDMIDFGNSMITNFSYGTWNSNGKSPNAMNIVGQGGNINKIDNTSYGVTNRPVGFSTGVETMQRTLNSSGYPALADGTSLSYLFADGTYADKKNTANINGLFQHDEETGMYYYDSRQNHAQYSNNTFTLYNQIITPNFIVYPFGNFLPFNDITDSTKATQVSKINRVAQSNNSSYSGYIQTIINRLLEGTENNTEQQLIDMLAMYRNSLGDSGNTSSARYTWNAADAINDYFFTDSSSTDTGPVPSQGKFTMNGFPYIDEANTKPLLEYLYNIDYDVKKNFFFGMDMHMDFMMAKGGLTGPKGDQPMIYEFSGDDDVWVYIDGVLFLDLSGIHRHVGGKIDFVNGKVYYYSLDDGNNGDVSKTPYATYTFAQLLTAAGKSTDLLNSNGTFKDYSEHTLDFYYMERGSGSSVCEMHFNMPLLRDNRISVTKQVDNLDASVLGNPDFSFQIWKEGGTELLIGEGVTYTVMDAAGNTVERVTGENGVFTIKAGDSAVFAIPENSGRYFVRELFAPTVFEQYGTVTVDGKSVTSNAYSNVAVGSSVFKGVDSDVKDISDGNTAFIFTNTVDAYEYGSLTITKMSNEYSSAANDKTFSFTFTIDGVPVPVGTAYTIVAADGNETPATVTNAGEIILRADETARFNKILAGTLIRIVESSASSSGYTVTYSATNLGPPVVSDTYIEGVIMAKTADTDAGTAVLISNDRKGTKLILEGTKTWLYPDGGSYSFDITLTQVASATDLTPISGGVYQISTVTLDGSAPVAFSFTLNFPPDATGTTYYLIREAGANAPPGTDRAEYILAVTTELVEGSVVIKERKLLKDSAEVDSIAFVNRNLRSLTVNKTLHGEGMTGGPFGFEVSLTLGGAPLSGSFETADGSLVTFVDGRGTILLSGGESLTLYLPYGAEWTVTETDSGGFSVRSGTASDSLADSDSVSGNLSDNAEAYFLNIAAPELPSTGGYGRTPWILSGMAVMLCALVLAYILRRKEEGGRNRTS